MHMTVGDHHVGPTGSPAVEIPVVVMSAHRPVARTSSSPARCSPTAAPLSLMRSRR
jgi:hypothetical protein